MSNRVGKVVICDKCGASVFLDYIDSKHLDGGYTKVDNYAPKPPGWNYIATLEMDLCPLCNEAWIKVVQDFKEDAYGKTNNEYNTIT